MRRTFVECQQRSFGTIFRPPPISFLFDGLQRVFFGAYTDRHVLTSLSVVNDNTKTVKKLKAPFQYRIQDVIWVHVGSETGDLKLFWQ